MNIRNEIKIFRKQLKQDFAIGILLFTRELMRTYKKSRMGMLVIVIPAITGALLTITLSAPENGTTRNMDMQMMLLWLALVDIGAFPIRINKRIRPLILTLIPDAKSIFVASMARGTFLATIRSIPILLPLVANQFFSGGLNNNDGHSVIQMLIGNVAIIMIEIFAIFSIGYLMSALYLNFMEINKFMPPFLMLIGYVSGYFPVNRPNIFEATDKFNPFAIFREALTGDMIIGIGPAVQKSIAYPMVLTIGLSILATTTASFMCKKLIMGR